MKIDPVLTSDYTSSIKATFHTKGKAFLKNLATEIGLQEGAYSIRSNKGGPAVSGEVTLHGDNIYVQLSNFFGHKGISALYRSCKSQKDYTGGTNNILRLKDTLLDSDRLDIFVKACKTLNAHSEKMNIERKKSLSQSTTSNDNENSAFGMR